MEILLINHYAGSKFHGMEYRPYYMAREWVRLGHRVTIVAASFSHLRSQNPRINGHFTDENIEGIRFVWLKTPRYRGNGIWRAINMFAFVFQLLRYRARLINGHKPDVVISSSTYPLDNLPAFCIARESKARLIYEVHDLWPLSPIELGGMSPRHPFIILMQWAENFAYRKADWVASMLPHADRHMREHGLIGRKFFYIPNGVEVDEWSAHEGSLPGSHEHALVDARRDGRFIVGYAGAHGLANALDSLIEAAALLQDRPVAVVLVGQGAEKRRLEEMTLRRGLKNVIFLPPIPRSFIPAFLMKTDVLYIGLKNEALFRFGVSPNKLMDYMMAGKPIIHAIETSNDLAAESGCGISVPAEDPFRIADAVCRLMKMTPAERKAMGTKGQEYVVAHHDYRVLAKRFLDALVKQTDVSR